MAVNKINGFAAPYRSLTLRNETGALVNRNGVLSIAGPVTQAGSDVTVPPLKFVQQGMVVEKTNSKIVTIPGSLLPPYFITVTATSPQHNLDDLAFQFAKTPGDVTASEVIIAEFDGEEWRLLPLLSIDEMIKAHDAANVATFNTGPVRGLLTSVVGANYETGPGSIIDKLGRLTEVEGIQVNPIVLDDSDWDRVDRIVYRRETDRLERIGRRQFILGGTYNDASKTAHDTQLESSSNVHRKTEVKIHTDNSAYMFVAEGSGISFDILFTKYASDRTTLLTASTPLLTATASGYSASVDSSGDIHLVYTDGTNLKYEKFDDTGSSLGAAVVIDTQSPTNPNTHIDPAGTKLFIVYQALLGPSNNQIYFTTRDITTGSLITAPVRMMTNASNIINPSIYTDKDLIAHVAYENGTNGQIYFELLDDIGVAIGIPVLVSGATAYTSTLVAGAKRPTIYVTDNKSVHVAFLQDKGAATYGLAIWRDGSARMIDYTGGGENFLEYAVTFDDFMNGSHLLLIQAARVDYYKTEYTPRTDEDVIRVSAVISGSGGSYGAVARDNFGSLLHVWSAAASGSYSNIGASQTVSDIGSASVVGGTATINLATNEFIVPAAALASIEGRAVISGSGSGNDGNYVITNVVIQDLNGVNDVAVVTVTPVFPSTESPAGGVSAQFQKLDGNETRFIKSVSSSEAGAYRLAELPTDNLLARLVLPGPVVLNYIPGGITSVDSDVYAIYGAATVGWEAPTADTLSISGALKVIDLVNNFVYAPPDDDLIILEDEALYLVLDGVDFTPSFQVTTIAALPWESPIQVLGFVKDGSFQPHLLAIGDVGELGPGEVTVIGTDLSVAVRTRLGIIDDTSFAAYTSTLVIGVNDSYPVALSKLDVVAGAAGATLLATKQNINLKLVAGGTWHWDLAGQNLTFTTDAYIQVPELADVRNTIQQSVQSPINLTAGQVAYVDINRTTGAATNLTVTKVAVGSFVNGINRIVIARRIGSEVLVGQTFLLKDGEYLELDGALAALNRRFDPLKLTVHETDSDKSRVNKSNINLLDGRLLSQEQDGLFLEDDLSAVIDWTTGEVFKGDGSTPLVAAGPDFPPETIPVSEYFWYGVNLIAGDTPNADNTIPFIIEITPADSSNANDALAPKPELPSTGKKLGAVQVYNNAGSIEVFKIRQLGIGSGSGGGGVIAITRGYASAQVGTTVSFTGETYKPGASNTHFYRNGVLMVRLASATPFSIPADAQEFKEVDVGPASTDITVNPITPSVATEYWEFRKFENTFEGAGLDEVTLASASVFGDGTGAINCSLAVVSSKTQVTLTSIAYNTDQDVTGTSSEAKFYVNGQLVSKLVPTKNDTENNILFEEVAGGTKVNFFKIVGGLPTPLSAGAVIEVRFEERRVFTGLAEVGNNIIPSATGTFDLGSTTRKWREIHVQTLVLDSAPPFSIANLSGPLPITGLLFSSGSYKAAKFDFEIFRRTDTQDKTEMGTAYCSFNTESLTWDIEVISQFGLSGLTLTIGLVTGQIEYTTNDLTGASYDGKIRIANIVRFSL